MTGLIGSAGRCALLPRAGRYLLFLAALAFAGCSTAASKPSDEEEYLLNFKDPNKGQYFVAVDGSMPQKVPAGSLRARVRVSGGPVMTIVVTVRPAGGGECEAVIMNPAGPGPYDVELVCGPPDDAGVPVAEAGVDTGVDSGPDLMADAAPSPDCRRYCDVMRDRCSEVYTGDADCLATCAAFAWPTGEPGRNATNSIECRIASAMKAPQPNDVLFCYEAGPTGGNRCGPLCDNYCDAAARSCPGLLTVDHNTCVTQCADPVMVPELRSNAGNTIECRIFWLGEAAKDGQRSCPRLVPGAQDSPCR